LKLVILINDQAMEKAGNKMKSKGLISSFIIFLCASALFASGILLGPTTASAATGMLVSETVDSLGDVGWDTSVAVDSKGWVHVSYYDATNGDLRHAVNAYGTWVIETVDSAGDVGWYSSMAFDSAGKPHIGYFDVTNGDLKHAYINASGVWVSEVVDSEGVIRGEHLSLAIDHSDNVHISYYDRDSGVLRYATNAPFGPPLPPGSPVSWTVQLVDSAGDVGWYTSIAVDTSAKVHISYYDADNMDLKYAANGTGSWVSGTIDSTDDMGWDTSIAVDTAGTVHISYYDATKGDLRHAVMGSSGTWVYETIDSAGDVGSHTALFVDASGIVHVAYHDYTNGALKYAAGISGGWVIETVDSGPGVGTFASLTADPRGDIHISYYNDIPNGDLKYAVARALKTLKKGFNFISAPTNTKYVGDAKVFLGFTDPGGDGIGKVLRYNASTLTVQQAYHGMPDVDNFPITGGEGLIIYALKDTDIDLLQDVCPEFTLKAGTNWVGTPCQPEHPTAFSMFGAIGSASAISIQRFNPGSGQFETAAFLNGQVVGMDFPIEGGKGYFIHMKANLSGFRP